VKRLTLMRHANAQWKDPQVSDFDRPLNRRGTSEAEAMSRRLIELKLIPTILLTSSARRAQQTADIVARELGVLPRNMRSEESLYLAPVADILRVIQTTGPRIPHLMIVGHNPGITEIANLLAPPPASTLPPQPYARSPSKSEAGSMCRPTGCGKCAASHPRRGYLRCGRDGPLALRDVDREASL